jgi:Holliday junction DNA helicase RuvA
MLDSLSGVLLDCDGDFAVLDVSGLRFRLEIPASTRAQLPPVGERAVLFARLSLNVNEGLFLLFGFATQEERDCFDIFTGISGIGPRKGLAILSQIEIAPFATAILRGDLDYLSKIRGVGKKTAERLIVELREKMVPFAGRDTPAAKGATASAPAMPASVADAIKALMALGARPPVAERAVALAAEALGPDAGTEALIREALKRRAG